MQAKDWEEQTVKLLAARKRHGGNEAKCNVTLFEDEGH